MLEEHLLLRIKKDTVYDKQLEYMFFLKIIKHCINTE